MSWFKRNKEGITTKTEEKKKLRMGIGQSVLIVKPFTSRQI